jgi:hypothetical protein
MRNVSQPDGSVIMMMIVVMDPTNENAQITHVRQKDSNVRVVIVLKKNLNVMEIATAWICQMKWIALLGIRMENTVLKINLNVITIFVYDKMIYVMVLMIVMTARMKRKSFVETFRVTSCRSSNAETSNAFPTSLSVMEKTIAVMEQMKII